MFYHKVNAQWSSFFQPISLDLFYFISAATNKIVPYYIYQRHISSSKQNCMFHYCTDSTEPVVVVVSVKYLSAGVPGYEIITDTQHTEPVCTGIGINVTLYCDLFDVIQL